MNEQIKQLAKQAGFYKYGDDFEDIIEKFAELIVKECIDIAFHRGHPELEFLLKHFGVE